MAERPKPQQVAGQPGALPAAEGPRVDFHRRGQEPAERKKKYLTAKYGQQQMSLIRKRLKVEMWLCEELQRLAEAAAAAGAPGARLDELDVDLDQLLDVEGDEARRRWLRETLQPLGRAAGLEQFIGQLLEQARLL